MDRTRIQARDAGLQLLNRLTFWVGAIALGAVGIFAATSAATIPGNASTATQASGSSSNASTSTSTGSSTSSSTSGLGPSSGGVSSSSSGSGMVATGASH